ncbi:MAG: FAD-dependent oxidoreductase, partial [Oscillospiraceae bacterium]
MAKYTAGTYTSAPQGYRGKVPCKVTFTADAIKKVELEHNKEVRGIAWDLPTAPIDTYPGLIVKYQTLNIPVVVGAHVTSLAILAGVADCVKQAGGDPEALKNGPSAAPAKMSDETITMDIVVVGGGIAGLSAGLSALQNGAKKVLLMEKQGVTGGSTARSGGKLLASNTKWQKKQGIYDNPEMMLKYLQSIGGDALEVEKLKYFCDTAYDNMLWLEKTGYRVQDVEAIHKSIVPWRVHNTIGGGGMTNGQGGELTTPLTHAFAKAGGVYSYNTTAAKLLTNDEGTVVGIVGNRSDGSVLTINAQAVIITTGGYSANREMGARYPENAGYFTGVPHGNLGDGLKIATAVGAKNYDAPAMQSVYLHFGSGVGINEEAGLILSNKGIRVANEFSYMYHVGDALSKNNSPIGWY